jgi:hypothetical protein
MRTATTRCRGFQHYRKLGRQSRTLFNRRFSQKDSISWFTHWKKWRFKRGLLFEFCIISLFDSTVDRPIAWQRINFHRSTACGVQTSIKSRMTSEVFVGHLILAGGGIRPVKRKCASTKSIDSGMKNSMVYIQKSFEKVSCRVLRASFFSHRELIIARPSLISLKNQDMSSRTGDRR